MNKQRKVLITTTYNEMGIIIDTKAEEVAQPNLQPTCNQLATDTISRQAAIDILDAYQVMVENGEENPYTWARLRMSELPSAQSETCKGCKHLGQWENEIEYRYSSPCTCCRRRTVDYYER